MVATLFSCYGNAYYSDKNSWDWTAFIESQLKKFFFFFFK